MDVEHLKFAGDESALGGRPSMRVGEVMAGWLIDGGLVMVVK